MRVVMIAAASDPGLVIGVDGKLPWKQLTDMERFRGMTRRKPVIMGRKTYDSLPAKRKPLPDRTNIVVTRQNIRIDGVIVVHTIEDALEKARQTLAEECCVIGGGDIYRLAMPYADVIELTYIHAPTQGTATFPELDMTQWKEVSRERYEADENNDYPYSFVRYERTKNDQ